MSERKKKCDAGQWAQGVVHSDITIALGLAVRVHNGRLHDVSPDRLDIILREVCECAGLEVPTGERQAVLNMAAVALVFGNWIKRSVLPHQFREAADRAEIDAKLHAALTDGAAAALAAHASAI